MANIYTLTEQLENAVFLGGDGLSEDNWVSCNERIAV
jgi:hypothetical protein